MRRLVWVGKINEELAEGLAESGYQCLTYDQLTGETWDSPPPLFVVNCEAVDEGLYQLARKVRAEIPGATGVLIVGHQNQDILSKFINHVGIFRVIFAPYEFADLLAQIQLSREKSLSVSEQVQLFTESREQNDELAELTGNLERIVEERTVHIERSRSEAEKKLTKMRRLVRLIKDMGTIDDLEGLMRKMRRELKHYHGLGEIALVFNAGDIQQRIMSLRGGKIISQPLKETPPRFADTRVNHPDDQRFLADNLGRPVARLIAVPLKLLGGVASGHSVMYVEHDMTDAQIASFFNDFSQIVQPLSLVLDRLLLEYRLRRSSYQWEYTFDSLPNPIAIINDRFETVRGNKLFDPSSGNEHCHRLFGGFESPCVGCPVIDVLKSGKPQSSQINAEGRIFQVHSYPIRLSHSLQISHVVNYYLDITHSRELYGKVIQNEKMAAVGLLAGNIAHELNNPLTGIRSLSQVLLASLGSSDEQLKADLNEVEKASARCQKTIRDLLEFSSTDQEKMQLATIDEIVNKTIPMLKTAMRLYRSNVDLNCEKPIWVEPHLLQQVVFNIVNNACQAMGGSGEISIETYTENSGAVLKIQDSGPGIPESIRQQVFEPFFTTKSEGQGTGLGLSMSKSIVEKFGGTIQLDSKEGEGTCFRIELPISEDSIEVPNH